MSYNKIYQRRQFKLYCSENSVNIRSVKLKSLSKRDFLLEKEIPFALVVQIRLAPVRDLFFSAHTGMLTGQANSIHRIKRPPIGCKSNWEI